MITAKIKSAERAQVTGRLTQWDVGQTIQVEGLSVSGVAYARMSVVRKSYGTLTVECQQSEGVMTVEVPDVLLASSGTLAVTIVDDTEDRATAVARFEVPIEPAARPADYVPGSPALVTIEALKRRIELAESEASSAVSKVSQALTDAEAAYARAVEAAESAEATDSLVLANEALRVSAESERESAEELRKSAEEERQTQEDSRKAAEASRESAEQSRAESEAARAQAEEFRASAEQARSDAEDSRVQAESMRVAAEQARDDDWTSLRADMVSTFNSDQSTRAQLFQESQDSRDAEFDASMGIYDADVEMAVQKAEIAASNANAAAASAEAHAGNYLRGEESGSLVHMEDAWPSPVRGLKVFGKSEQFTTTGKNLFDESFYAGGYIADDGSDAPNANASYYHYCKEYLPIASDFYFRVTGRKYAVSSTFVFFYDSSKAMLSKSKFYSTSFAASVPDGCAFVRFYYEDKTQSELATFLEDCGKLQVELGSTATSYEPYTGGKPSPSPEYPQEIKSIAEAEVWTAGKNLIEPSKLLKIKVEGDSQYNTKLMSDGYYAMHPVSINKSMYSNPNLLVDSVVFEPLTQYTLSLDVKASTDASNTRMYFAYSDGTDDAPTSNVLKFDSSTDIRNSVTSRAGKTVVGICGTYGSAKSWRYIKDVCLVKGTATDYSPYTGSTTPVSLTAEDGTVYELRSLPDGTRDEVGIVDGKWVLTKRVGNVVLDGVTEHKKVTGADNGKIRWIVNLAPQMKAQAIDGYSLSAISDVFIADGGHNTWAEKNNFSVSCAAFDRPLGIAFVLDSSVTTVEGANAWLAVHTPTVDYRLATEELIDLGPADTPLLPETVSNVWAVSEPSTEINVTYERDVTVAYQQLEQAIASITA